MPVEIVVVFFPLAVEVYVFVRIISFVKYLVKIDIFLQQDLRIFSYYLASLEKMRISFCNSSPRRYFAKLWSVLTSEIPPIPGKGPPREH